MSWLDRLKREYQGYTEGLPPPPPPVDTLGWRTIYPDEPMPLWKFNRAHIPQPTYNFPNTISWVIPEEGNVLYASINTSETWEEHFLSRGWQSPQDQIDAGYPYYLQPTFDQGNYEEVWDAGAVFSNVIVNVDFSTTAIFGQVAVTTKIATSIDGSNWTAFVTGTSRFVESLRYIKVRIEFSAAE
jgi:hypothetical protein